MNILITGVAGFIGYHLSKYLLQINEEVYGIDNLNSYYDVQLKLDRLNQLKNHAGFNFEKIDLNDREALSNLFFRQSFDYVVNLAAQVGVRYSIENPHAYVDSNLTGFVNLLEGCRHNEVRHLVFASSSSVYGANKKIPFSVSDDVNQPISLYAATKRANELIAYSYSHLYQIPTTGLRFFTVYGPWGRPDMAYFKFVKAIEHGEPINVYNFGDMQRDFTFIDDVVEGIVRVMQKVPMYFDSKGVKSVPHKLYNIGNNKPISLIRFIEVIEQALGKKAEKNFLPMQPGDVPITCADVDELIQDVGFSPNTRIEQGIDRFVAWYREYYGSVE